MSAAAVPGTLTAQTDETVRLAQVELEAGEPDAAYTRLAAQAGARAGDPAFDFLLGVAAIETGRYGEAIIALQRVLAIQPGNAPARAELARAYAMAGDIDTAREEFNTVVADPSVPDPVRQRFSRLVRDYDRQRGEDGAVVTGFIDVEMGYDSNINAATDDATIILPLFAFLGPATLNPAARARDEAFYQLQGGVSVDVPLGRQTRLFASALGNWRDNLDSGFADQFSVTGTAGISHTFASGNVASLSGQAQRFVIDGDGFRAAFGIIGRYAIRSRRNEAVAISGQYFRLDYDGDPLREADRFAGSITYAGRHLYGGIGGGKEETVRARADHLSFGFFNAQLGLEYPVSQRVSLLAGAGVEYRDHDGQDPLFLIGRKDWRIDLSLGLRAYLSDRVSIRPRVTYTHNDTNIALYEYDRWTAGLGLRFEF
ncbi:tetratricopeptide repeat protein [Erythrobacter aureus]|nr:tetratricopeptide repeat protein [Erythrobacter aureus]